MKQRWLVVVVGLPALLAVLLACPAWATMIVVCGIAGIAAYELLHTAGENVPANFYWGLVTTVVMQEIWLFKEEMSGTYDLPLDPCDDGLSLRGYLLWKGKSLYFP